MASFRLMPAVPPRRAVVLAILFAVGLVGCTSGSAPSASATFDPKAAARQIRQLGRVDFRGRGSRDGESGIIAGQIRYRPYEVLQRLPVVAGSKLAEIQYRRIGDEAWVRRAIVTTPGLAKLGFPLLVLRGAAAVPFLPIGSPDNGIPAHVGMPYDPARLLDRLGEDRRVRFRAAGSSPVAGQARARYSVRVPASLAVRVGVRGVMVWVDDAEAPVQLRVSTVYGLTSTYRVTRSTRPFAVQPPPEVQTENINQPLPDATGEFAAVYRGDAGGTAVTILRAPGDKGWSCWKVVSSPAYQPTDTPRPGSGAVCAYPLLDTDPDAEKFAFAIDANATTPYELIGVVVPTGSTAEALLVDGTTVSIPVTPDGLAIYAGSAVRAAGLVTITLPSHVRLVCGPGGVNSKADVAKLTSPDAIRGQPWNCLPEDDANLLGGEERGLR